MPSALQHALPEQSPAQSVFPLTPTSPANHNRHIPLALDHALNSRIDRLHPSHSSSSTSSYDYPLQNCHGLLELIHDDVKIELDDEERFYRAFDEDSIHTSSRYSPEPQTERRSYSAPSSPPPSRGPASVFSNDIWIDDAEHTAGPEPFARGVHIVGWTSVGDKRGGAYIVYDCAIHTRAGPTLHLHRRFSAFLRLHRALLASLPPALLAQVPDVPPKAALARYRAGFLDKRRRALEKWLAAVLLHPQVGACAVVRAWVLGEA